MHMQTYFSSVFKKSTCVWGRKERLQHWGICSESFFSSLFSPTGLLLLILFFFSTCRLNGSAGKWSRKASNTHPRARNFRNLGRGEKSKGSLQSPKVQEFSEEQSLMDHISKERNNARSSVSYNERGDIIVVKSQLQKSRESASQLTVATAMTAHLTSIYYLILTIFTCSNSLAYFFNTAIGDKRQKT